MRADHGAATRVYVHNLCLVDTDTACCGCNERCTYFRGGAAIRQPCTGELQWSVLKPFALSVGPKGRSRRATGVSTPFASLTALNANGYFQTGPYRASCPAR